MFKQKLFSDCQHQTLPSAVICLTFRSSDNKLLWIGIASTVVEDIALMEQSSILSVSSLSSKDKLEIVSLTNTKISLFIY